MSLSNASTPYHASPPVGEMVPLVLAPQNNPSSVAVADVAIIIVNYNSGPLLARCLLNLQRQVLRPRRVLVVDNASADSSLEQLPEVGYKVELVRLTENVGFAAANNRAIQLAHDVRWIALLNADAFPEPNWLQELLTAAEAHPAAAALGSLLVRDDDPRVCDGVADCYHTSGFAYRLGCGQPLENVSPVEGPVAAVCAAAALYRREAIVAAGGLDERYFCYLEDVDLCLRLWLLGHECRAVPRAIAKHVGSGITGRQSDFTLYHAHRNLVWTWLKCLPALVLLRSIPQHLLLTLVSLLSFSLSGHARAIWRAKWHALRGLPTVWRQRRMIQSQRIISSTEFSRLLDTSWIPPYLRKRR